MNMIHVLMISLVMNIGLVIWCMFLDGQVYDMKRWVKRIEKRYLTNKEDH